MYGILRLNYFKALIVNGKIYGYWPYNWNDAEYVTAAGDENDSADDTIYGASAASDSGT
jgi:hypothetical protein